ncbi:hypothetical protein ONZ45_g9588 [Pleurotus djamor]|nr:hypothetical protein ONZ45_g9588 [Pleurotus djamor]
MHSKTLISSSIFLAALSSAASLPSNDFDDNDLQSRSPKAADYAPAIGMAAKVVGQALGLPSAQNMPMTGGYGMGMGMGMGMDLLGRELSDEEIAVLDARAEEHELFARKAADYAPAIGMAAKVVGQALGLPSAQNMPMTGGYGMGMGGMGMGMGMGYYKREAEEDEEEHLQARKAADYAPAIGMAAKVFGQALGLPSAQNMPMTGGYGGYSMGMGMGMYRREDYAEHDELD